MISCRLVAIRKCALQMFARHLVASLATACPPFGIGLVDAWPASWKVFGCCLAAILKVHSRCLSAIRERLWSLLGRHAGVPLATALPPFGSVADRCLIVVREHP